MATPQERPPDLRTIPPLIRWHGYAALACVLYVALLGLVMSIKLHAPDWLGGMPWLSWGRLRYAHTQGLFFGWLGNAFLAFLYFAVPGWPLARSRASGSAGPCSPPGTDCSCCQAGPWSNSA